MKKLHLLLIIKCFFIVIAITACNSGVSNDNADLQENEVLKYFENVEVQYETKAQKKYIVEALNDILNLSEKKLKQKKYEDYMGKEYQWNLHELLYYHFMCKNPTTRFCFNSLIAIP